MAQGIITSTTRPSRESLADSIYAILFQQIVEGVIQADSAMNIDSLSRDLGVSPTPIREALARLESTGLVVREALRGYRAAPLFTTEQLLLMMDARATIEPSLARLASLHADPGFIGAMRANLRSMREMSASGGGDTGYAQYRDTDEAFHDLIASQSGNPFLKRAFESIEAHVHRFRLFGPLGRSDVEDALREHTQIFEAIERGDADAAFLAMQSHIELARQRSVQDREKLAGGQST